MRSTSNRFFGALALGLFVLSGILSLTRSASGQIGCSTPSFVPTTNVSVGNSPESIAAGDFNGDGNIDLVTANLTSNGVSVLLGNGAGIFSAPMNFPAGLGPNSVNVADF